MDVNRLRRTIDQSNPELEIRNQWWKEGWWHQRECTGRAWWAHHKMRQAWRELGAVHNVVIRLLYLGARERDRLRFEVRRDATKALAELKYWQAVTGCRVNQNVEYLLVKILEEIKDASGTD